MAKTQKHTLQHFVNVNAAAIQDPCSLLQIKLVGSAEVLEINSWTPEDAAILPPSRRQEMHYCQYCN